MNIDPEPFVGVASIAEFLEEKPRNVLRWTREGRLRGYPVSGKQRHQYKFRKSEVADDVAKLRSPSNRMTNSSPSDSEPEE